MGTIKKAVFPVAGLGTRFLPATKASPKEMLPVVDKPLIQYAVEEAVEAGAQQLIFVTSGHKRAIEDHFDQSFELEYQLEQKNKQTLLAMIKNVIPSYVQCVYVRQHQALGLGHAVLCARHLVGNDDFAVLLADDLIDGEGPSCLKQMADEHEFQRCGVVAVQEVSKQETDQYGIVKASQDRTIQSIIEKPSPEESPSNLAVVGRYILPASIFSYLASLSPGSGNEIQLTDAIASQVQQGRMIAHRFRGTRYDCGDKLGFLIANYEYAKKHPDLGKKFMQYVRVSNRKKRQFSSNTK
jgi:UTP--glucose-1-phosphate uridylyltransferase